MTEMIWNGEDFFFKEHNIKLVYKDYGIQRLLTGSMYYFFVFRCTKDINNLFDDAYRNKGINSKPKSERPVYYYPSEITITKADIEHAFKTFSERSDQVTPENVLLCKRILLVFELIIESNKFLVKGVLKSTEQCRAYLLKAELIKECEIIDVKRSKRRI